MAVAHEKDVSAGRVESSPRRAWWRWFHRIDEKSEIPNPKSEIALRPIAAREISLKMNRDRWPWPKPEGDLADVLIMGTTESKAPAVSPGAVDLLDTLVREHLERTSAPGAVAEEEGGGMEEFENPLAAEATAVASAIADGPTAEERSANLQREIEALLAGEPKAEAAVEEVKTEPADTPTEMEADGQKDGEVNLTSAELEVLLKGGGEELRDSKDDSDLPPAEATAAVEEEKRPEAVPEVAVAEVVSAGDPLAAKMEEAEGVLAEELAQLMAETQAAETPPPSTGTADWTEAGKEFVAEMPEEEISEVLPEPKNDQAELSAAVQAIMQGNAGPAQQAETSLQKSEAINSAVEAVMAPPAGAPEHPVIELELPPGIKRRPGILQRMQAMILNLVMLILQVLDLPFGWVKEAEKNAIGVAAFCLLMGGFALFGWVCWLARH